MAISVLGISGSLRAASFNTALLRAAQTLAPEGMTIEIADITQIPLYNLEIEQVGFPPAVQTLRSLRRRSIITPTPLQLRTLSTGFLARQRRCRWTARRSRSWARRGRNIICVKC
jgi:hypothetical protein